MARSEQPRSTGINAAGRGGRARRSDACRIRIPFLSRRELPSEVERRFFSHDTGTGEPWARHVACILGRW